MGVRAGSLVMDMDWTKKSELKTSASIILRKQEAKSTCVAKLKNLSLSLPFSFPWDSHFIENKTGAYKEFIVNDEKGQWLNAP